MVRFFCLGLAILFSGSIVADFGAQKGYCEANLSGLNISYEQSLKYLLKLQREIDGADAGYPADRFVRMGIGRAVGPLIAALNAAGDGAGSLPVDLNRKSSSPWTAEMAGRFEKILDAHLPLEQLRTKPLVLLVYDEKTEPILAAVKVISDYLQFKNLLNEPVRVEFLTSQSGAKARAKELAHALPVHSYTVRPMAPANEVRHWFHEALIPGPYDFSQHKLIDLSKSEPLDLSAPLGERHHYQELKKDLALAASKAQN